MVKNAEMSKRIPIDRYKSTFIANLINNAPLNKSALKNS